MEMDGESSCESDISESWSLIDINEESLSVTETPSEAEETLHPKLKDVTSRRGSDIEIKNSVENFKEIYEGDFGPLKDSESKSSFREEDFVNCSDRETEGVYSSGKKTGEDDGPHDSDDVESIEILDMDGNYRDSDISRLDTAIDSNDSQTYQSEDEEFLDESISEQSRNNSSSVIKRKKKKFVKDSQGLVNSVNSEESCEKCDSKTSSNEGESNKENCEASAHPVLKHYYKNNVATAVLSLSLSVIFAGVACIAIGHFLGVQDAGETKTELVDTLKKLQVENAALQSRLFHLNRVLLNREANSKAGALASKGDCMETPAAEEGDLNGAALSEIRSSLSSVEWLSKLQNLVRKDKKGVEDGMDFNSLGKYIHDQLDFLLSKKEGGLKLLEDADRKISRVLQKIVTRLSSSQENIENLCRKLINIKDKLNKKLDKVFPDRPREMEEGKPKLEKRLPVTELDLQLIKWKSDEKVAENSLPENPKSVVVYEFPQPEKYYQVEIRSLEKVEEKQLEVTNSSEASKEGFNKEVKKEVKKICESNVKSKHKKRNKEKSKMGGENKEKRSKRGVNKPVVKQSEKEKRKKRKVFDSEPVKGAYNELMGPQKTKYSKTEADFVKRMPKYKKMKKSKSKKSFPSKLKKSIYGKKRLEHVCSMHQCFNSTGFWVFKWADGREELRRQEALGDWQFERARGREELRDEDYSENWQFRRALGRESNRVGGRWRPIKRTRLTGKEFFHDRFS